MCVLAKRKRLSYEGSKVSGDVKDVLVSDYKPLLAPGVLVIVAGEKYVLLKKETYKCYIMSMTGKIKKIYYKFIDYFYFMSDTSKDRDIIAFIKGLNLGIVEYKELDGFLCKDGSIHSYSYLFRQYLKTIKYWA